MSQPISHCKFLTYCRYSIAKSLVRTYGNVRIFNAEECHRPKGREDDPRLDQPGNVLLLCVYIIVQLGRRFT